MKVFILFTNYNSYLPNSRVCVCVCVCIHTHKYYRPKSRYYALLHVLHHGTT